MKHIETTRTELAVIGSGLAGLAASYFAAASGVKTCQTGISGGILYATGFLDVMGVHPIDSGPSRNRFRLDPAEAIDSVRADMPDHPYARLKTADIFDAVHRFMSFLEKIGLGYRYKKGRNTLVFSSVGTIKPTYAVPESMWEGALALENRLPCLMVDFWGLKGYSALQIVETFASRWPGLKNIRIAFPVPQASADLYPEHAARCLELDENIEKLAKEIGANLNSSAAVGLPAVCGIMRTRQIVASLSEILGVPVFEVPTMPPSVPGLRIKEHLESALVEIGVLRFPQQRVNAVHRDKDNCFVLDIGVMGDISGKTVCHKVIADAVILASGRFLGMGLCAGRKAISEPLFNLPVFQPEKRLAWHRDDFFDPSGHPLNRAGIEVNQSFMPVNAEKSPVYENLFACGSILAHQDWIRQKCGAGLSVATAYAAVQSAVNFLGRV